MVSEVSQVGGFLMSVERSFKKFNRVLEREKAKK